MSLGIHFLTFILTIFTVKTGTLLFDSLSQTKRKTRLSMMVFDISAFVGFISIILSKSVQDTEWIENFKLIFGGCYLVLILDTFAFLLLNFINYLSHNRIDWFWRAILRFFLLYAGICTSGFAFIAKPIDEQNTFKIVLALAVIYIIVAVCMIVSGKIAKNENLALIGMFVSYFVIASIIAFGLHNSFDLSLGNTQILGYGLATMSVRFACRNRAKMNVKAVQA